MLQLFYLIFIIRMGKQTRIDQNKRQGSISNIKTKTEMMIGATVCVEHKFTNSDANTYDVPKRDGNLKRTASNYLRANSSAAA
jgi:hypothetical protein